MYLKKVMAENSPNLAKIAACEFMKLESNDRMITGQSPHT